MSSPPPPPRSSSPTPAASPQLKTWHQANCHCGTVRYRVFLPPLAGGSNPHPVMSCNCSLCTRNGYLNVYPHRHEICVRLHDDTEAMPGSETVRKEKKDVLGYYYVYGGSPDRENEHVFCKSCGSSLWVDVKRGEEKATKEGKEDIVAVNVSGVFLSLSSFLFLFWLFGRTKKK